MKEPESFDCEDVYDNEISPLMTQIIEICNEHKIPMLCDFIYKNDEDSGLGLCTTLLNGHENRSIQILRDANRAINSTGHSMAITITKGEQE
jgi:hypothetical protein